MHHLSDLEDEIFADTATVFSSFTYLITAARHLGSLLKLNESFLPNNYELVSLSDTSMTIWLLKLPDCKREPNDARTGEVDEVLFQTHFLVNGYVLLFIYYSMILSIAQTPSCQLFRSFGSPSLLLPSRVFST